MTKKSNRAGPEADRAAALADRDSANAEIESLNAERPMKLLGEGDELRKHDEDTAAAIRRRDQAAARVEAADQLIVENETADRVQVHKAAEKAAAALSETTKAELTTIVAKARDLIERISEANVAIAAANIGMAEDRQIAGVEARVRAGDVLERTIVSETIVDRWCYESTGNFIPDDAAKDVRTHGGDAGSIEVQNKYESRMVPVVLKRFTRIEYLPRQVRYHSPLLQELQQIAAMATVEIEDNRSAEIEWVSVKAPSASAAA